MPKSKLPKPTAGELAILKVLWRRGPSTVREVQAELEAERGTGYTTTLKLMQIMHDKGLVRRDDSVRTHVYEAAASQDTTQRQLVGQLLAEAFDGSTHQLVLAALTSQPTTPAELAEIRKLLDELATGAR